MATVEDGTVEEEDEEEIPTLSLWAALILLIGVTVSSRFPLASLVPNDERLNERSMVSRSLSE